MIVAGNSIGHRSYKSYRLIAPPWSAVACYRFGMSFESKCQSGSKLPHSMEALKSKSLNLLQPVLIGRHRGEFGDDFRQHLRCDVDVSLEVVASEGEADRALRGCVRDVHGAQRW